MIRVLLVGDEAIVREGLRMRLTRVPDIKIVGEAMTGTEAFAQVQQLHPDVVLMDLSLPDMDGIAAIRMLRTAHTTSTVVILSLQDDVVMRARARAAGAEAFISKYDGVKAIVSTIQHLGQH